MDWIPIQYYIASFYSILCVFLFFMLIPLFSFSSNQRVFVYNYRFNTLLIIFIVILFIGLRDAMGAREYFGDTKSYTNLYQTLSNDSVLLFTKDPGFYFFMKLCSNWISVKWFYILCASLYLIPPYIAFKKWFGYNAFIALVMFVVSLSFLGYGINGIRNGLATSFFIYALAVMETNKIKSVLAYTFHQSLLLPFIVYFLTLKFTKTKLLIRVWLFLVVASYFFGTSFNEIINNLSDFIDFGGDRGTNLFADELDGRQMNRKYRLDFILYSGLPILFGYFYSKKITDKFYTQIFNIYIINNCVWLFLIYAAYSNRIAYLSWFLIPIILIYPLLKYNLYKNQNNLIGYLVFGSLLFTLLNEFL